MVILVSCIKLEHKFLKNEIRDFILTTKKSLSGVNTAICNLSGVFNQIRKYNHD